MNEYELKRAQKIAANKLLLQQLDLPTVLEKKTPTKSPRSANRVKKVASSTLPGRASARLAARPEVPSYKTPKDLYLPATTPSRGRRSGRSKVILGSDKPTKSQISSPETLLDEEEQRQFYNDTISSWIAWEPTEPEPTRDENGTFHFDSHPLFRPNKAPWEVMREGAFGGGYWRRYHSLRLGITISDDWRELPATWLHGINPATQLTSEEPDPSINKYGTVAGQSLEEWEQNGWISHQHDVRGWFQWYCRFFQGRRCDDDDRQIMRWANCAGANGRWLRILLKKYVQAGIRSVNDEDGDEIETPSPRIHQTLLQWAVEVNQDMLDEAWQK